MRHLPHTSAGPRTCPPAWVSNSGDPNAVTAMPLRSLAVRREVLVILRPGPVACPAPARILERARDDVAGVDHSLGLTRPVGVGPPGRRRDVSTVDVRVLDGVDVDRAAVRVLRPYARTTRNLAAVECRRVVS